MLSLLRCACLMLGLLGAALMSPSPGADALMFQSQSVSSQWDTWAFAENGTFYA